MTIDVQKLEAIDVELKAYAEVLSHVADERTREAMMAHIDALLDDRARAMGLPEDEIARIN